jgi:hypothetical protein
LQRRRAGGKIVPKEWSQKKRQQRGKFFPFAEKESRSKNGSPRMESKEKAAEGKGFPFPEKESRRKNCSTRIELKR